MNDTWVPKDVNEAKIKFDEMYGKDSIISTSMLGILQCRIGEGESFIKAYENTLRAYIEIAEKKGG